MQLFYLKKLKQYKSYSYFRNIWIYNLPMILNISKIKTEALLLFCRDLINTYKDVKQKQNLIWIFIMSLKLLIVIY